MFKLSIMGDTKSKPIKDLLGERITWLKITRRPIQDPLSYVRANLEIGTTNGVYITKIKKYYDVVFLKINNRTVPIAEFEGTGRIKDIVTPYINDTCCQSDGRYYYIVDEDANIYKMYTHSWYRKYK